MLSLLQLQAGSTEPGSTQQPQDCGPASAGLHKGRDPSVPQPPAKPDPPGSITLVLQEVCAIVVRIKAQIYPCHNIYRRETREQPTDTNRKKCYAYRAQTLPLVAQLLEYQFLNVIRDRENRVGLSKLRKTLRYFPYN